MKDHHFWCHSISRILILCDSPLSMNIRWMVCREETSSVPLLLGFMTYIAFNNRSFSQILTLHQKCIYLLASASEGLSGRKGLRPPPNRTHILQHFWETLLFPDSETPSKIYLPFSFTIRWFSGRKELSPSPNRIHSLKHFWVLFPFPDSNLSSIIILTF